MYCEKTAENGTSGVVFGALSTVSDRGPRPSFSFLERPNFPRKVVAGNSVSGLDSPGFGVWPLLGPLRLCAVPSLSPLSILCVLGCPLFLAAHSAHPSCLMPEPFDSIWLLHLQHKAQLEVLSPANLLHRLFPPSTLF